MGYNSRIAIKKCKCGCDRFPTLGYKGFNIRCFPQELKDAEPERYKKGAVNARNRVSLSNLSRKVKLVAKENDAFKSSQIKPQEQWYQDRRSEMTGCCIECGYGTNVKDDKYYRWSVCHIVPKGLVPSVATYEHNWIELCQTCHQEFDNTFDRAAAMKCFGEAKMKFRLFQKLIPANELRKVNPHLIS